MPHKKDDLKTKLLAQAEVAIEKMLSDERMSEQMTLSEIEDVIGELETDFRQRVLKDVVGEQRSEHTICPECGSKMRNKGKHSKRIVTLRGETDIERRYWQCQVCSTGVFPPR